MSAGEDSSFECVCVLRYGLLILRDRADSDRGLASIGNIADPRDRGPNCSGVANIYTILTTGLSGVTKVLTSDKNAQGGRAAPIKGLLEVMLLPSQVL